MENNQEPKLANIIEIDITKIDPVGVEYGEHTKIYVDMSESDEKGKRLLITIGNYQYMFTSKGSLIGMVNKFEQ